MSFPAREAVSLPSFLHHHPDGALGVHPGEDKGEDSEQEPNTSLLVVLCYSYILLKADATFCNYFLHKNILDDTTDNYSSAAEESFSRAEGQISSKAGLRYGGQRMS